MQKALKKAFAPEFLNRIDDVVVFNTLTRDDIFEIIDIELKGLHSRMEQLGYHFDLTDNAKRFLSDKGYDDKYGARPLQRAIQKYVEDEMAEVIIDFSLKEGDKMLLDKDPDEEKLKIKVEKAKKKKDTAGSDGDEESQESQESGESQESQESSENQE